MSELRALIVDFGGVLTSSLSGSMGSWAEAESIDTGELRAVMSDWLGTSYGDDAAVNPIHALERGEIEVPDFERELATRLRTLDGHPVEAEGLLVRMFAGFELQSPVSDAVKRVKRAGFATALLSNSWGNDYPRDGWDEMFDAVVISGEVGMRKPDHEIFRLTARKLDVAPEQCVFVDDLMPNVAASVEVGMVGVHHVTPQQTVEELEALFDVSLHG